MIKVKPFRLRDFIVTLYGFVIWQNFLKNLLNYIKINKGKKYFHGCETSKSDQGLKGSKISKTIFLINACIQNAMHKPNFFLSYDFFRNFKNLHANFATTVWGQKVILFSVLQNDGVEIDLTEKNAPSMGCLYDL